MIDRLEDSTGALDLCQYLLVRPEAIRAYVDALGITPTDTVLEAGGGRGTSRGRLSRAVHGGSRRSTSAKA